MQRPPPKVNLTTLGEAQRPTESDPNTPVDTQRHTKSDPVTHRKWTKDPQNRPRDPLKIAIDPPKATHIPTNSGPVTHQKRARDPSKVAQWPTKNYPQSHKKWLTESDPKTHQKLTRDPPKVAQRPLGDTQRPPKEGPVTLKREIVTHRKWPRDSPKVVQLLIESYLNTPRRDLETHQNYTVKKIYMYICMWIYIFYVNLHKFMWIYIDSYKFT